MGFKIIDPTAGHFAPRGRKALENTVRMRPVAKLGSVRFTISNDLLSAYQLAPGDKVNVMLGTDEDHGCLVILKTSAGDPKGYSIYSPGVKAKVASFNITSSKVYGLSLKEPVDLIVNKSASRGLMVTIPASVLSPLRTKSANGAAAVTHQIA